MNKFKITSMAEAVQERKNKYAEGTQGIPVEQLETLYIVASQHPSYQYNSKGYRYINSVKINQLERLVSFYNLDIDVYDLEDAFVARMEYETLQVHNGGDTYFCCCDDEDYVIYFEHGQFTALKITIERFSVFKDREEFTDIPAHEEIAEKIRSLAV